VEVRVPYDTAVQAAQVRAALERRPDAAFVSVVHCDTPTGIVNDLDGIAAVVAEHGALLAVDTVAPFAVRGSRIRPSSAPILYPDPTAPSTPSALVPPVRAAGRGLRR
jgi:aspartate aminotransferase-like enzyme